MRDIHCPKDIGLENTFTLGGEDCEKEQYYNDCYHCWSTALAKRNSQWMEELKKLKAELDYAKLSCALSDVCAVSIIDSKVRSEYADGTPVTKDQLKLDGLAESEVEE